MLNMPEALISIDTGKERKDYIEIMGKSMDFKRSNVKLESRKGKIIARIKAEDSKALLASMQSFLKKLSIVSSIDSKIEMTARKL
jgi:tRNA threonylcarbamoyladenosine modification (KEOPS) complex  Pcc1 subunit